MTPKTLVGRFAQRALLEAQTYVEKGEAVDLL